MTEGDSAREIREAVDAAVLHAVKRGADIAFGCMLQALDMMPDTIRLTAAQWAIIVSTARKEAAK